ncbi:MAG: C4-type zinc ribbon domain-containing protein [Actinomycetota bacterium]
MASEAYEQILHIQALDLSLAQLRHRIDTHPARAAIAEVDASLAAHDAEVATVAEHKHELERTQKRLEDEVAIIEDRRKDIDGKLYGGEVTASKELLALQDEAASLLSRQNQIEDEDLEVMEQIETIDETLAGFTNAREALEASRHDHDSTLATDVAELEQEITSISADRSAAAAPANAELLASYESLRDQFGGQPVARLVGSSCDGCHMQLSAVAVDQIGKMPEDAVVNCEECGRLLVR